MPTVVLIEQFHLDLYLPRNLEVPAVEATRVALGGKQVRTRLRKALRAVLREFDALRFVWLRISH